MQPMTKHRELTTGGVVTSTAFTISVKDQAHIKSILRDTLYSDKIMAVLREYSANAWDAHRAAKKPELPIRVQLPTELVPMLEIQDWGTGLSHEEVFEVFARYGASTKRDSNEAVGMLGIGSKSGFAYADTFTIISCHGGKRRTYVALLDQDENDAINLLSEVDDPDSDPGITIQIAVKPSDIDEFRRKARMLFQHFNPRPNINIELPEIPKIAAKLKQGMVYGKHFESWHDDYGKGRWFALMGCVAYRVDLNQLKDSNGTPLISEAFGSTGGLLYFDIGQIQINASREDLKYSHITKDALVQKFTDLLDEYICLVLNEIDSSGLPNWEKRLHAHTLLDMGLGKKEIGEWADDAIELEEFSTFVIQHRYYSDTCKVNVDRETRLLKVMPEHIGRRKMTGYHLGYKDLLIVQKPIFTTVDGVEVKTGVHSWDEVNIELEKVIQQKKMEGIPIANLHDQPWTPKSPRRSSTPRISSPKHFVKTFQFNGRQSGIASDYWDIVNRTPEDDDIFVILQHFETAGVAGQDFNFYTHRHTDRRIAEFLGITLPPIYGYKTTQAKPVTVANCKGIHYPDWRKQFYDNLKLSPEILAKCNACHWRHKGFIYSYSMIYNKEYAKYVCAALGPYHPISQYLVNVLSNLEAEDTRSFEQMLQDVGFTLPEWEANICEKGLKIEETYPLLSLNSLWQESSTEWARYIQLIDCENRAKEWEARVTASLAVVPSQEPEKTDEIEVLAAIP